MNNISFRFRPAFATVLAALACITGCAATTADDATAAESLGTTASMQTREHILLARTNYTVDLSNLAGAMGTRDGRVVIVDAAGARRTFAVNGEAYVAGATVLGDARFDLCEQGRAGLTSCAPLASAPSSSGYECDEDACDCSGVFDCLVMVVSSACAEGTLVCEGSNCFCDR